MNRTPPMKEIRELRQFCPALELAIPTTLTHNLCKARQTHWNLKSVGNTLQWNIVWWNVENSQPPATSIAVILLVSSPQGGFFISFLPLLLWSLLWWIGHLYSATNGSAMSTRQASFAHNYGVELSNAGINRFSDGFFPSTSCLWNSFPSSVFPASFNLRSFKRQVYYHLRDQMAWFFFFITLLRYFIIFFSFHCLSFPFPKGFRLEKGHIVPVLFPFIKKKKKLTDDCSVAKTAASLQDVDTFIKI